MRIKILLIMALGVLSCAAAPATPAPRSSDFSELKFDELFDRPIGPRGLQISERSKALAGSRVRIVGYMVRQDHDGAGMFLLAPVPVQLHNEHYGLADDLPAATVFVSTPFDPQRAIQYKPGLLVITGVLSVGNREESDGRISTFRIALDRPKKQPARAILPVTKTGETLLGRRLRQ